MSENEAMSRRTFLKRMGLGVVGGTAMAVYPFLGERFWYQVKDVILKVPKLPLSFVGWRVVQISDIHLGFYYGVHEFRKVVRLINKLKPDLLVFTGDFIHRGWKDAESAIPLLQKLHTPRGGKWAVLGNHDVHEKKTVIHTLKSGQFHVLQNTCGYASYNGQRLYIAGVKDALLDDWDIGAALQGLTDQDCIFLLAHEPDIALESWKLGISAQFSGHSHGGQVRIPFLGPVFTPDYAQTYVDGLYHVGDSGMPLYVNRGIGCTHIPVRFWCRPEITVFHLQ